MTSRARRRTSARHDATAHQQPHVVRRVDRGRATLAVSAVLGASVLLPAPANAAAAATFTVTNTHNAGVGSLRAAINDANHAVGTTPDVVTFAPAVTGVITLTSGDLEIRGPVDIQGPGADTLSIDAQDDSRIFSVQAVSDSDDTTHIADTTISGLTLTRGNAAAGGDNGVGGAVYVDGNGSDTSLTLTDDVLSHNSSSGLGGAIDVRESGAVTLTRVTVSDNTSRAVGGLAVDQSGAVNIVDSTVSGNQSDSDGVGIDVRSSSSLTISASTISDNTATSDYPEYGASAIVTGVTPTTITGSTVANNTSEYRYYAGGISVGNSSFAMADTRVTGNSTPGDGTGGGLLLYGVPSASITGSLIDRNTVKGSNGGSGGGLAIRDSDGFASRVTITNSTLTDNTAPYYGAIDNRSQLEILSSTITDNAAGSDGGVHSGFRDQPGTTSLINSVVSGNTHGDLSGAGFTTDFSLIQDPGTATYTVTTPGSDLIGADPLLGDLADNGGPTLTRLPAADSPVLDAGTSDGLTTDQRHLTRPVDIQTPNATTPGADAADMGAVELQGPPATPVAPITPALTPSTILGPPTRSTAPLCHGLPATIIGKPGEPIDGTPGPDVIIGTAGPDTIHARGGDDTICADAGNDHIHGGTGDDHIYGGAGQDHLFGGRGDDSLQGGRNRDRLRGGLGTDSDTA